MTRREWFAVIGGSTIPVKEGAVTRRGLKHAHKLVALPYLSDRLRPTVQYEFKFKQFSDFHNER